MRPPTFALRTPIGPLPRLFHSGPPLLARRPRERNRPKPPTHPSVPSFKTFPQETTPTATTRRRLLGIKSRANSNPYGWKLDPTANIMRRKDGIAGKYEHSKVDWMAEKRSKFFQLKQRELAQKLDERYVADQRRDPALVEPAQSDRNPSQRISQWSLPSREWNRGAPSLVNEYGREPNPIYTFEQRRSLAVLRETALAHEKQRQEIKSGNLLGSQDSSFWDYEKNFRNPLYDFFRGGVTIEENSVSDSTYHCWSVAQLRRKSFQDLQMLWYILLKERNLLLVQRTEARRLFGRLVDPVHPYEPLTTIRDQLKAVQFSLRNIKGTVAERRRAIEGRIKLLAKYQSQRGRDPYSYQWQMAIKLERQRIQSTENHELKDKNLDQYFGSNQGRDQIRKILSKQGLRASAIVENMKVFDLNQSSNPDVLFSSQDELEQRND